MAAAKKKGRKTKNDDDSEAQDDDQHLLTDQQKEEEVMFKSVFNFYQQNRGGVQIERYELPMLLDSCGYKLSDETIDGIQEFLDTKNAVKLDVQTLIMAIKWYKESQMTTDYEGDVDEYLDAFVALGGDADREGTIPKQILIAIIKEEFELTIDMVEYLSRIGDDDIGYNDFCVLLDAGTSGQPSRVSSYLSQNKGSSFMRFSYFVNNMDKLQF